MNLQKQCTYCKRVLDLTSANFYKSKEKIDGFSNTCKDCKKQQSHKSYEKHKKSILKRQMNRRQEKIQLKQQNPLLKQEAGIKRIEVVRSDNIITSQLAALLPHNPTANQVEQVAEFLFELSQKMKNNV
jgi:hypothetical protein